MMDQVFINDLIARGSIGVNDWEREKPQEILINIVLFADLHEAGRSDNIQDTVNDRTVAKKVLAHAETAKRQTGEALAADDEKSTNMWRIIPRLWDDMVREIGYAEFSYSER